ncbi:MAG: hypothetical protein M0024_01545 [Nitrospiraceae bacterium]|nr:hypothetical protein [Nitrospiraceae bacterium]
MKEEKKQTASTPPGGIPKRESPADVASPHDSCRCKEVARKTPQELLKLMISDLAFWRKKG